MSHTEQAALTCPVCGHIMGPPSDGYVVGRSYLCMSTGLPTLTVVDDDSGALSLEVSSIGAKTGERDGHREEARRHRRGERG